MAASLLEAAGLRRRKVSILLYGARPSWGPDRPLVLDDRSVARLASLGIPIPTGTRLEGARTVHGEEDVTAPRHLSALPRHRVVLLLRSLLHAQGVELSDQLVSEITPTRTGGWVLRVGGASHPVDAVVLACGAGAPLATTIPGHRAPPTSTSCLLRLSGPRAEPWMVRIPQGAGDDLWVIPQQDGVWASRTADGANTQALVQALIERAARGDAFTRGSPSELSTHWVPAGVGVPGVPALGSALGGSVEGLALGEVGRQATQLAAAILDGGMEQGLETSRREARSLAATVASGQRVDRLHGSFSDDARARVLRKERMRRGARPPGPAQRTLSGAEPPSWSDLLLSWLLLVIATVAGWLGGAGKARRPVEGAPRSRAIYIVEDDPAQAEGLASYLQARGFSCVTFPDALRAAVVTAHEPPAVMVLDLALPWIDGVEAIRALEQMGVEKVPILITSGLTHLGETARARLGAVGWFSKPLDLEALVRRLSAYTQPEVQPPQVVDLPGGDGTVGRI